MREQFYFFCKNNQRRFIDSFPCILAQISCSLSIFPRSTWNMHLSRIINKMARLAQSLSAHRETICIKKQSAQRALSEKRFGCLIVLLYTRVHPSPWLSRLPPVYSYPV